LDIVAEKQKVPYKLGKFPKKRKRKISIDLMQGIVCLHVNMLTWCPLDFVAKEPKSPTQLGGTFKKRKIKMSIH